MARLPKPSSSDLKILPAFAGRTPHWPTAQKNAFCKSTGAIAQPGKVISKHERRARREASISNLDGLEDDKPEEKPEDDHGSFAWLGRKMRAEADRQANQYLTKLDQDIEQNWAPEACINNVQRLRGGRHPYSARSCIVLLMAFLIVFGTAHTMITYLLSAFRVSAACTPTTVFIPVTYTSTVTYPPPASDASAIGSSNPATTSTIHSTIYSTQTMTNTVTVLSSAGSPTSYAATVTTTQLVSPVSTLPVVTSLSTYTPPAYTSTTFSFVGPPVTLTSTSTMYSTVQVSYASSSSSSRAGMGPSGWNSTSSAVASPATPSISGTAVVETLTATYYYGTGDATTSTATTLLTTTITVHGTSTVTLYSTSFDLTSTSTSSTLAAITASASSSSSSTNGTLSSSPSASTPISTSSALVSAGSSSSPAASPPVYSNATSMSATSMPASGAPSLPATLASSSQSANASLANGLGNSLSATSSSIGNMTLASSTTAAVIIPITSTLPSGQLTTMLETTSTTIALMGTGTYTASGYFVWNGTTTIPYPASPATASSSANITTAPGPAQVSPAAGSSSSLSTSSSSLTLPYGSMTYGPSSSALSSTGTAPSITVPVNGSTAALSMLSSVLSGLTESSTVPASASATTSSATSVSTSSSSVLLPSTSLSTASPSSNSSSVVSVSSSTLITMVSSSAVTPSSPSSSSAVSAGPATFSSVSNSSLPTISTASSSSSSLQTYSFPPSVSSTATPASSSNPFPASSATATPTACGEHGNFTMDFDNLPNFQPNSKRATDITQAPPVPNPYHHLTFSDGYVYAPQPSEPYLPSSEPHLAVFLANGTGVTARSVQPGEIGDGPYESNSAFWFDAFSAMMGCDNAGPDPCTIVFTGYTYSAAAKDEIATYTQNATVAPCPALNNCPLQPVSFPTSFRSLSGVRMQAFVGNEQRMFLLDDMELGWSNNTCQAGMTRQRYHGLSTTTLGYIHKNRGLHDAPKTHDELMDQLVLYDSTHTPRPMLEFSAVPMTTVVLGRTFYDALGTLTVDFIHADRGLHHRPYDTERVVDQLVIYDETHFPGLTGGASAAPAGGRCLFLSSPPELRNRIYEMVISDDPNELVPQVDHDSVVDMIPLLFVSKQVWHEAIGIWYNACDFQLQFIGPGKNDAGTESCTKWLHRVGSCNIKHVRRVTIFSRIFANRGYWQPCEYGFRINLEAKCDEDLVESRGPYRRQIVKTVYEAGLKEFEDQLRELARKVRAWESKFEKRTNLKGWEVVFRRILKLQKGSRYSSRVP
ncbi:hypothetical protein LTR27_000338 [Elasticomyces elasticus]|nr:hypothetical protein LTR27_000338 [Elasticomyces elasticus]